MYSTLITSGCFTVKAMSSEPAWLKGTQSAMGPRWPGHLSVWKAFTSTRNQIYPSDTFRNPLQFCLMFHSILDLLLKTSFWANSSNSSYYIILSRLVNNSIQRNMNRRGEKRLGAVREISPSFTKITRERISNIGEQKNRHIYLENRWKRLHIFGKSSFLDLESSTIIQTPCNFSPLLMFEFGRIGRCLAFPESPSVNSQWYIKRWVLIWLRAYNHDFGL